jgi:hypothetical protein
MGSIHRVVEHWRRLGISLLLPDDEERIRKVFAEIHKPFAPDLIEFCRIAGGMDEQMDNHSFFLWPLWKVRAENLINRTQDIEFGDVLLDAFRFRFRLENSRSAVYGGYDDRKLADSIEDFFTRYLEDPASLDLYGRA